MSDVEFDLFGDPIPDHYGEPGRPEHVATQENVFKVKVMVADGRPQKFIAGVLGISVNTFKKHYLTVWSERRVMRDRMKVAHKTAVMKKALEGDTGAMRLAWQIMQKDEADFAGAQYAARQEHAREQAKKKAQRVGKKEQASIDASNPDQSTAMGRLIARRQGSSVN